MGRARTGNAWDIDGRIYIAVSAKGRRYSKSSPMSTTIYEGRARARLAAQLVDRLIAAKRDTPKLVDAVVQECATLPTDKLGELGKGIAVLIHGNLGSDDAKSASVDSTTYGDVAAMWTSGDLHKRFPDLVEGTTEEYAANVASKLRRLILPLVQDVPIASFTVADAERVMERLPAKLSKSTRKQTALFLRRVLAFAVYPLRLIPANPIPPEFMPKAGRGRERNMLFVDEDMSLLGCVESPIALRLLFGFQNREGMRREEVCSLEWRDVDLDRGWVYLDKNKTDTPRDWPLGRGVVEALARWRKLNPSTRYVFGGDEPVDLNHLAHVFRECLKRAGVDRPQLHEQTRERMRAGTHDLRATFVTLSIAQGKSEGFIKRRTGHKSSSMIERYRRNADNLGEGSAVMLLPLFLALPELHAHAGPIGADIGVSSPPNAYGLVGGTGVAAITNEERPEDFPDLSSSRRDWVRTNDPYRVNPEGVSDGEESGIIHGVEPDAPAPSATAIGVSKAFEFGFDDPDLEAPFEGYPVAHAASRSVRKAIRDGLSGSPDYAASEVALRRSRGSR